MSEQMCVCGHPAEYHDSPGNRINGGCAGLLHGGPDHDGSDCQCRLFRPCLPWPDSEGWWCAHRKHDKGMSFVETTASGEFLVLVLIVDNGYEGRFEYWNREKHDIDFGPARFVKLTEKSPFGATP